MKTTKTTKEQAAVDVTVGLPPKDTFFDLSFQGGLPQILRELASRLEANDCEAAQFDWSLSKEQLRFTAMINMRTKG